MRSTQILSKLATIPRLLWSVTNAHRASAI